MPDPDPQAVKQVLAELRETNKERRRTAVMKLGMLGGDEAVTQLSWMVSDSSEDLIVRGRAARMLGMIGDARAVDPLIRALDAPGLQTPMYAAESLGKLGDTRAVEPLLRLMTEHNDRIRDAAAQSLRQLGYFDSESPGADADAAPRQRELIEGAGA